MNSTTNAPIAPQSAFARPAALVGGAIALVAVTAIATTLTLQSPPPRAADAGNNAAPVMALSTAVGKPGTTPPPEAPADFPDKMSPAGAAPAPKAATAPRTVHIQRGSVKAVEPTQHAVSVCATCGKVESVSAVQQKGEGSGLGAVGGAVVGGLLGHQVGGGSGKSVATVLGAVGGGMAGNEIEKRQRATTVYQVKVRMDDGSLRTVTQGSAPAVGQNVTVEGSTLRVRASAS